MGVPDDSPYTPPLPDGAGPYERVLHEIYGFATPLVDTTATDWGKTSENIGLLATAVRDVITKLQTADEPWEGPAATSAYQTLDTLAKALDDRAAEIDDIRKGLKDAVGAAETAESSYVSQVRSISLEVDETDYQPSGGGNFNITAYEAAIDSRKQQREEAARQVLQQFDAGMTTAAKKMPVESTQDPVAIDSTPGGSSPSGGGGGGTGPSSGTYVAPTTHHYNGTLTGNPTPPTTTGPTSVICSGLPEVTPVDPPVDPTWPPTGVDLDGDTTGTTSPTTGGSATWAGGPGGSTGGPSGGLGAGAAGAGGLLGGAAMLGKGLLGKAGAFGLGAGRPGPLVAGSTGTAARGGASGGRGAAGASSGRPVVAPGQQGQGRGGRGAAGAAGGRGGRSGAVAGSHGAAGRRGAAGAGAGGRGRKDRDEAVDVDTLTNEDQEVWFEGEEDSSPPVWR